MEQARRQVNFLAERFRDYRRVNGTTIVTLLATGTPSLVAGLKRHIIIARIACSSRPNPILRVTLRSVGRPRSSIRTDTHTSPSRFAALASSVYSGFTFSITSGTRMFPSTIGLFPWKAASSDIPLNVAKIMEVRSQSSRRRSFPLKARKKTRGVMTPRCRASYATVLHRLEPRSQPGYS